MLRARRSALLAALSGLLVVPLLAAPASAVVAAPPSGPLLVAVYDADVAAPARAAATDAAGAQFVRDLPRLHAQLVRADPADAAALRRQPGVRYVEPVVRRVAAADAATPERAELGLDRLAQQHPDTDGRGTVVAVLDTGVDATNPDLAGRVTDGGDFTSGHRSSGGTVDGNGHGTGVAAIAAAAADGAGMVGAAPGAQVRSYKVLDADGSGGSVGLALAIRQVADDAAGGLPIAVANMSLGGPFRSQLETDALAYAARRAPQVLFVAASGNDGSARPSFPAAFAGVFSVGASEQDGNGGWRRAPFSNQADVDVLAPGVGITTYDYVPGRQPPTLGRVSGTSEASPAVAGLVADLASGRGVRGQQAAALLKAAALPAADTPSDGSGRVNVAAADQLAGSGAGYSAVFADLGARLAVGATRTLVTRRYVPDPQPGAPAGLSTSAGTLQPGAVTTTPAPGGALVSQTWTFRLTAAVPEGHWTTTGDASATRVPFALLDRGQGEDGAPARSGRPVRAMLGVAGRTAVLVSFGVRAGQSFTLRGQGPTGRAALFVWAPGAAGRSASSYEEPDTGLDNGEARATWTAPTTGRYVAGWVLTEDGAAPGSYSVQVDYAEPRVRFQAPAVTALSGPALPFRVSWSGASSVDVQWTTRRRTVSGWVSEPWHSWLVGTRATSAAFGATGSPVAVQPGQTYWLRAVPHDALGNVGEPSPAVPAVVPLDDRSLQRTGGWTDLTAPGDWLGTGSSAWQPGRRLTAQVEAARLTVLAERGPRLGRFAVRIDGVRRAVVDLRASSPAVRQIVWDSGPLAGGLRPHAVVLEVLGTAGRSAVVIDGLAARH